LIIFFNIEMKTKIILGQLLIILLFGSCEYDFPETELPASKDLGEINTENVITAGDRFLAGAMDGALYSSGQQNSLAAVFALQLNKSSETTFIQPDIDAENGFNFYASTGSNLYGKWIYRFMSPGDENPVLKLTSGQNVQDYQGDKNFLNNLAVPMLSVAQLSISPLGSNPYIKRVFRNEDKNITEQIVEKSPTFVLCWFGMNDFLNFAMNGATNSDDLTSVEVFQNNFSTLINDIIQKTDSKILLGNLVSFEYLPYFYLKQYNFMRLSNQEKAAAQGRYYGYNQGVAAYNAGLPADQRRPFISFEDNGATLYPQPVVVEDNSLPDATYPNGVPLEKYRQLTEGEMALLSITDEMVNSGYGSIIPLPDKYYLTTEQIDLIKERYNFLIR